MFDLAAATAAREILRALSGLLKGTWRPELAQALISRCARLAELSKSLGMAPWDANARGLGTVLMLCVKNGPDGALRARIVAIAQKLQGLIEPPVDANLILAYLLTDPDSSLDTLPPAEIARALAERGFGLRVFYEGDSLSEALLQKIPAVLIAEAALMPALSELLDNLERERPGLSMRLPLVALNREVSAARRLSAALGGAEAYLEAPRVAELVEQVLLLTAPHNDEPYQVLIVDDDRQQAMYCAGVLKRKGMVVQAALSAEEALLALTKTFPDLVLMDLYLPGLNGMELTALLRQRSDSLVLPIVFLSGEQDTQKRFDALNIGGDDYLTKPIRPRHLTSAVASRIRRVRALRAQLAEARRPVDSQGLHRRSAFLELLQNSAERPAQDALAVLYLAVDHGGKLLGDLGLIAQSALEQELASRLSQACDRGDALTSLGNFEFAVLARRTDFERVLSLAEALRECVLQSTLRIPTGGFALTLSVGVVEHADARGGAERWLTLGHMACQRAQRHGGNRIERGFHDTLRATPGRLKAIENVLRETPGRNNTLVEFQPFVPLRGEPLPQYELLLRLRGDTIATSMLTRGDFAAVAERIGVETRLDRFACQQAIEAIREAARYGKPTRLFVRCSTAALLSDLIGALKSELSMGQIDPKLLCLEFDLPELELDLASSSRRLETLRTLGTPICLNLSLARPRLRKLLDKLRPDVLKIHAALLSSPADEAQHEFTQALADAQSRAIVTIAWGVPQPTAIASLWALKIDYVLAEFLGPARATLDFAFNALHPSAPSVRALG